MRLWVRNTPQVREAQLPEEQTAGRAAECHRASLAFWHQKRSNKRQVSAKKGM